MSDTPPRRTPDHGSRAVDPPAPGPGGAHDAAAFTYARTSGGVNVFPAEVESALIEHPKIADVVVIGLKDDDWGRRVHAVIEPADPSDPPTLDDIRSYAKGRLHAFKVPKTIEIVDAIPRSSATKVNRGALIDARGG